MRLRPSLRGAHRSSCLCVLIILAWSIPARGQTRYAVVPEPDGTAVGLAVLLHAGTAWEGGNETGLTYLAAESVVQEARPRLHALGARIALHCTRSAIEYSLLLPVDRWRPAARVILDALFDQEVSVDAIERARLALSQTARGAGGGFSRELSHELAAALNDGSPRWARDSCDPSRALDDVSNEAVQRWVRTRLLTTRATGAIVGPVDEEDARHLLGEVFGDSDMPLLIPAPTAKPGGGIHRIERDVVTSWLAVALPFDRNVEEEVLRLLAFVLEGAVQPAIDRPGIHDVGSALRYHGEGGELIVYLVVEPDEADRWIHELRREVATLTDRVDEDRFNGLISRYRGARLLELATPEARAREAALQLFLGGPYRSPTERIDTLTADRLRRAASALYDPLAVILGPTTR